MNLSRQTRNQNVLELCKKYAEKRKMYKEAIRKRKYDKSVSLENVLENVRKLEKLPRNSSKTRYRNRCSITGRARRVFRFFGICGHKIRELAMKGELPGISQKSW